MTATSAPAQAPGRAEAAPRSGLRRMVPRRNPWGHPWFLEGFTWLYLIWSLVPIGIAVLFSFNNGKSQSAWQGFSWRWYFSDPVNSVLHNPQLHAAVIQTVRLSVLTTLIAVPLGVSFALGINRWRGITSSSFNFLMILSFVIPELIFGVAMFFAFTVLFKSVHLGTLAEVLGLVTWNVSWPAIIVQARLVGLGKQYEEAAADLGANQFQTIRRVMVPLLGPAIFASAVLVFSSVIDDFVIVDLLSSNASNTPISVIIYSQQHGGNGGPALNALGTIALVMSLIIAVIGYIGYRWMTRGERGSRVEALTTIAGTELTLSGLSRSVSDPAPRSTPTARSRCPPASGPHSPTGPRCTTSAGAPANGGTRSRPSKNLAMAPRDRGWNCTGASAYTSCQRCTASGGTPSEVPWDSATKLPGASWSR